MNLMIDVVFPVIGVVCLVFVVAFFAASETAFLSITKVTIKQMLKDDNPHKRHTKPKLIASLKGDTNKLLSLILIGINFITSLASALAANVAINLIGSKGTVYATVIMAFLLIIFGEIVPKTIASVYPVQTAGKFAVALITLEKLLFPVVWIFSKITGFMTTVLNLLWKSERELITEDELKSLIQVGEKEGTLEHSEKDMLYKIFDFPDLRIYEIMHHRSLVKFVDINSTYDEIAEVFEESGYSRLPVCKDGFEDVVGMLHYKDVLITGRPKQNNRNFVRNCMTPALFVPETLTTIQLLQKFKKEKINFAIAVDENGSNSGIVTMDDILRTVFGHSVSIENKEVPPESRIFPINALEYLVPGDMRLDDVNDLLDLDLDSEEFETLGGWIMENFDCLPESGDSRTIDKIVYKVEEQELRRVKTVRVKLTKPVTGRRTDL